ncbi:sulfur carrier protein ThiS [Proteinivorax hydrogeniformans]|uniref:Sulfur carrier protein ThiS n=1 Tax=Proteinivorax hydrogeniformans TaxID=1826727 RepID=A0AAU8HVG9_9FIRM
MVVINGKEMDCDGMTVTEMLKELKFDSQKVVVEINQEIIDKVDYASQVLDKKDKVEIVGFVGGG